MRIAFLSPLPPAPTGIADYSSQVLHLLADRHRIDVFHDQDAVERQGLPASCRIERVEAFLPMHRERPYDVAVYQMGNGTGHAFLYEPLARVPGLLVLHDLVLHHSRARMFLEAPEALAYASDPSSETRRDAARQAIARYEDEVAYNYPAQSGRLAATHLATVGALLPYAYPLFRIPVEASRLTAVHNEFMARTLDAEIPGVEVARIALPAERAAVTEAEVAALRSRHGIAADEFVVGTFGLLTPEKRIETLARAVARASTDLPRIRLLLVGPQAGRDPIEGHLARLGLLQRGVVTGRVPLADLPTYIDAADLVVHLRYPTARETSAALLRVLAQGRPTVISDLEHLADIPADAVVRADLADEEGEVTRAILHLAARPEARARLGRLAAGFVRRAHSPKLCRDGYEAALERAARLPDPPHRNWPRHWAA